MIFEVTPEHIEKLSDEDLRILIGALCEQEALRSGNSPVGVTYSGHQNAADGGIDVAVDVEKPIDGYVPRQQTGFQSKAEDMSAAAITKEMRPDGKLRDSIRLLGEKEGAYILVSSKGSVAAPALTKRVNAMAAAIADEPTAAGLKLEFYDRRRMASWVNQHPGLIPWVRLRVGQPISGWQPFADWSSSPVGTDQSYFSDAGVRVVEVRQKDEAKANLSVADGINRLRTILGEPTGCARLVGLSGLGKTRLVQALFDTAIGADSLSPGLAIYTDESDSPSPTPQDLVGHLHNFDQRCVLIVDNCGAELHQKLKRRVKAANSKLSLITIEYDISDDEPEQTDVFRLEPASAGIIKQVVHRLYPKLTAPEIETIADFSEGNSRVAIALASTAEDGESLAKLNDGQLFERLFKQKKDNDPVLLKAAQAFSLAYSFEGEALGGDAAELPLLAGLVGLSAEEAHGQVAELFRRKLVQRRGTWRAVLPHALALRLARYALENIPLAKIEALLTNEKTPHRLVKSMTRRLGYLHDSSQVQTLTKQWLGKDGWLSELENLNGFGIKLFQNLAAVDPELTLICIEKAAEREPAKLGPSYPHKDALVSVLRSIAYDADKFERSCMLLLRFADPEAGKDSRGDAMGVFASLFLLFRSGTHAPQNVRIKLAEELIGSPDELQRKAGWVALEALLSDEYGGTFGFNFGTRKRDYGYWPKVGWDVHSWYEESLALLRRVAAKDETNLRKAKTLLADTFEALAATIGANEAVISTAEEFQKESGWPEGYTAARAALKRAKEHKQNDDVKAFEAVVASLSPTSLAERIAIYVTSDPAAHLADIEEEDEDRYTKAQQQVEAICRDIGKELAADPEAFKNHLPTLLASDSQHVWNVAAGFGEAVADPRAAWNVMTARLVGANETSMSLRFFSAFVMGVHGKCPEIAEELLDAALGMERLHPALVQMHCVIGIDERAIERLAKAAVMPSVPAWSFRSLGHGRCTDNLAGAQFKKLLLAVGSTPEGVSSALEVLHMRIFSYRSDKRTIGDEERQLGAELLSKVTFTRQNLREDGHIATIAEQCLVAPKDESVARDLCAKIATGITKHGIYSNDFGKLVAALAAKFPFTVLDNLVEKGRVGVQRNVFQSLRSGQADPLRVIADDQMVEWASKKPSTRFLQLAEAIRPWYHKEKDGPIEWTPAALRLVGEAPDPVAILNKFAEKMRPSSWSGSLAQILTGRLGLLEKLASDSDEKLSGWAKAAVETMKQQIEQTQKWEESHERQQDERFEYDD